MPTTVLQKQKTWTYNDYLTLPDDLTIYEVIEGELYMTPAPIPKHQEILFNLAMLLTNHIKEKEIGKIFISPIDVLLDPQTVVQPDIIFISNGHLPIIKEKNIQGPPYLVIEILSPSTIQKDRIIKMKSYAKHGVKNLWLVDPDNQTFEIYELDKKKTYRLVGGHTQEETFKPSLFPNLTIPLKEVWG